MHLKLKILLFTLLICAFSVQKIYAQEKTFTLVIDPGHGGKDPGALGRPNNEKTINLAVAKALGAKIEKKYPEIKVIYTRSNDKYIPLRERTNIANRNKADLFISIHCNSSENKNAKGCQTFTLGSGTDKDASAAAKYENSVILSEENFEEIYMGFNPNSSESYIIFDLIRTHDTEKSISLAEKVQKNMVRKTGLRDRGVSMGEFLVLHTAVMPSILIELAFISNKNEMNFLHSKNGQNKFVDGIFAGFCEYYEEYKENKARQQQSSNTNNKQENQISSTKDDTIVYKVQIMASKKFIPTNDRCFKGYKVDYFREGNFYKYTYGENKDYNAIVREKRKIEKVFKGCYIVAFKNGVRVDVNKVRK